MVTSKDKTVLMLSAVDALGRRMDACDAYNGKQAGVFYFLWIGQHRSAEFDNSVLDIETQRNDRTAEDTHHYWGKPLLGYYDSGDPWVFRKHLQMLTLAGVDYLVFDTTNSYYYEEVCHNIFPVALEMIEDGWNIPRFIFDTNCRSMETVTGIYNAYYDLKTEKGRLYAPLWYRHPDHGDRNAAEKPWIIAKNNDIGELEKHNYDKLPKEIKNFFYLRESAWFVEDKTPFAFATDVDYPSVHEGMLSVSIAQHTSGAFSDSVFEAGARDSNRGRGYSAADGVNDAARVAEGSCFEDEWNRAFDRADIVDNVFISTWNEWVAQKQPFGINGRSCCYFVDQYNEEFSRDAEPVDSALGDNYYMQMAANIRKFKSTGAPAASSSAKTIDFGGGAEAWKDADIYRGFHGDGEARNFKSANHSLPDYKQQGADNDITCVRVACDGTYIYFRLECADNINMAKSSGQHLNIWIAREGESGYAYRINGQDCGTDAAVHRLSENGQEFVCGAARILDGNTLSFKVPLATICANGQSSFCFKATDGFDNLNQPLKCYSAGKSLPLGRFNFLFKFNNLRGNNGKVE